MPEGDVVPTAEGEEVVLPVCRAGVPVAACGKVLRFDGNHMQYFPGRTVNILALLYLSTCQSIEPYLVLISLDDVHVVLCCLLWTT